jgi:hypothetical protein
VYGAVPFLNVAVAETEAVELKIWLFAGLVSEIERESS